MANRRAQHVPEDYNAFGYDPRGRMANSAALLFGEAWRPDPVGIQRYNGPTPYDGVPPRYGPPAPHQQVMLPHDFVPNLPHDGYLGALRYQRQQQQPRYAPPPHPPPMYQQQYIHYRQPVIRQNTVSRKAPDGPHPEIRPGVYRINASMSTKTIKKEFSMETDIPWLDFQSRCCANLDLDPNTAELGYRISGQEGPKTLPAALSTAAEFSVAMTHIIDIVSRARSKTYGIEVVDLKPAPIAASAGGSKKRSRDDDIPHDSLAGTLTVEYQKLKAHLKCEACKGYCHITRAGNHQRLDYKEMSYWAKSNALGHSDIYNPPDAVCLDHRPKRFRGNASSNKKDVHVHVELPIHFGGSVLGNRPAANVTQTLAAITPPGNAAAEPSEHPPTYSPIPETPLSVQYPPISSVIQSLCRLVPGTDFMAMLHPLQDAGIYSLNDAVLRTKTDLVTWTGLPEAMIGTFYAHAKAEMAEWEALGRFGKEREVVSDGMNKVVVVERDSDVEGAVDEGEDDELLVAPHRN